MKRVLLMLWVVLSACDPPPPAAIPPYAGALPVSDAPLDGLTHRLARVRERLRLRGYEEIPGQTRTFALEGHAAVLPLDLPATGVYVPTQARDVAVAKTSKGAAERMSELVARTAGEPLAAIERRALAIAAGIRGGNLVPIPAHETECRFCAVSGGCRKPRFAMAPLDDADDDRDRDVARPPRDGS